MTEHPLIRHRSDLPATKPPPPWPQSPARPPALGFMFTTPRYRVSEVKKRKWRWQDIENWLWFPGFGVAFGAVAFAGVMVLGIVLNLVQCTIASAVGAYCSGGLLEMLTGVACP